MESVKKLHFTTLQPVVIVSFSAALGLLQFRRPLVQSQRRRLCRLGSTELLETVKFPPARCPQLKKVWYTIKVRKNDLWFIVQWSPRRSSIHALVCWVWLKSFLGFCETCEDWTTWDANKSIEIRRPTCTTLIQPCIWYEYEGFRDMNACCWLFGMVHKEWSSQFDLDLHSWILYHRNLKNEIVHTVCTPYICTSLSNSLQKLGNASEQKFRCFVGIHFDLRGGASEQRHKWAEGACGSRGAPSSGIWKNGERNVIRKKGLCMLCCATISSLVITTEQLLCWSLLCGQFLQQFPNPFRDIMPPSTVECLAVLRRTRTSGNPKIGSHGSISKKIQKTLFQEMLHMLPYPQSCQGQRKDREEAKDILAECVKVSQVSAWIGSTIQFL